MYTNMDQWAEIRRRVLVEGASKRSIQREYKIHWKTLSHHNRNVRCFSKIEMSGSGQFVFFPLHG